jgi:hypothetical protein
MVDALRLALGSIAETALSDARARGCGAGVYRD